MNFSIIIKLNAANDAYIVSVTADPSPEISPYLVPKERVFLRHIAPIGPSGMPVIKPISIPVNKFLSIEHFSPSYYIFRVLKIYYKLVYSYVTILFYSLSLIYSNLSMKRVL